VNTVLETRDVTRFFGAVKAADHLSVQIDEGQIVGIVGPNGSGKTTFINIVTGYIKPAQGAILFKGQDVTGLSPRQLTKLGITRSFQIPQLYTRLSILENMLIALSIRSGQQWQFWQPLKTQPPPPLQTTYPAPKRFAISLTGMASWASKWIPWPQLPPALEPPVTAPGHRLRDRQSDRQPPSRHSIGFSQACSRNSKNSNGISKALRR